MARADLFASVNAKLKWLQRPQTRHDLHNLAGRAIHREVMRGFEQEMDPHGVRWIPSKRAQVQGRRTLRDTGALQDGIRWRADSRQVEIKTTGRANRYARFHQDGAAGSTRFAQKDGRFISAKAAARRKFVYLTDIPGLPARPFMPEGELPRRFRVAMENDFRTYIAERWGE